MMNSDKNKTEILSSSDERKGEGLDRENAAGTETGSNVPLPGWTRLLVFVFMIGNPAFDSLYFASVLYGYEDMPFRWPFIDSLPLYRSLGWSVVILSSLVSLMAGYSLWKKRKPSSVRLAKWALWLTGPLYVLVMHTLNFFFLIDPAGLHRGPEYFLPGMYVLLGYLFLPLSKSLVWTIGWTIYLGKSQRIREIYGYSGKNPD